MWWGVDCGEGNVFYFEASDESSAVAVASRDFHCTNLVNILPLVLGEFKYKP